MEARYSSGEPAKGSGERGVGGINLMVVMILVYLGKEDLVILRKHFISHFLNSKDGQKCIILKKFNLDMDYLLLES